MAKAPLKSEKHHWWPISLQNAWRAPDGFVSVIRPDGRTYRAKPSNKLGAIGDAHHIKIGEPWDTTFEPQFSAADASVPELISWILNLESSTASSRQNTENRVLGIFLSDERNAQLASVIASLIARSPMTRMKIRSAVNYYSTRIFGEYQKKEPINIQYKEDVLVAINQQHLYEKYNRRISSGGRWIVLFSDSLEFVMGDGFLHDFSIHGDAISGTKIVVPILPSVAILYVRPSQYSANPRLLTLRLNDREVHEINNITCIYSKDFIFYANKKPHIDNGYKRGEHLQFEYHRHEWLDNLLNDLSQIWFNERTGSVGIGPHRPYGTPTGIWAKLENYKKIES